MKKPIISLLSMAALSLGVVQAQDTVSEESAVLPNAYESQSPDDLVKNTPGPSSELPDANAKPRGHKSQTPGSLVRDTISEEVIEERGNERMGLVEGDISENPDDGERLEKSYQRQDPDAIVRDTISDAVSEERVE